MGRVFRFLGMAALVTAAGRIGMVMGARRREQGRLRRQLKKDWSSVRGNVRKTWNWFTEDELDRIGGEWNRLVKVIRRRTGNAANSIENELRGMMDVAAARS
jgi:uncharacterized protein YjbJ (UPF0337 family)